jgi:hypothetical protein
MRSVSLKSLCADARDPARVRRIFADEGLVIITQALPPTVCAPTAAYLTAALEQISDLIAAYGIAPDAPDRGRQVHQLLVSRGAEMPAEDRHVLRGHFPLSIRLGEELWRIPLHLADHPFLYDILGVKRLFMHMPPTARFVLPGNVEAAVPAHQDVSYNKHLGAFCVVWVPLVDIDGACGGMAAYPRSHGRGELLKEASGSADNWLPGIDTSKLERVELQPLAPGDVVVMSNETVHESMPNRSGRTRLSIDFRFFGDNSRSSKHFLDLAQRRVVAPA